MKYHILWNYLLCLLLITQNVICNEQIPKHWKKIKLEKHPSNHNSIVSRISHKPSSNSKNKNSNLCFNQTKINEQKPSDPLKIHFLSVQNSSAPKERDNLLCPIHMGINNDTKIAIQKNTQHNETTCKEDVIRKDTRNLDTIYAKETKNKKNEIILSKGISNTTKEINTNRTNSAVVKNENAKNITDILRVCNEANAISKYKNKFEVTNTAENNNTCLNSERFNKTNYITQNYDNNDAINNITLNQTTPMSSPEEDLMTGVINLKYNDSSVSVKYVENLTNEVSDGEGNCYIDGTDMDFESSHQYTDPEISVHGEKNVDFVSREPKKVVLNDFDEDINPSYYSYPVQYDLDQTLLDKEFVPNQYTVDALSDREIYANGNKLEPNTKEAVEYPFYYLFILKNQYDKQFDDNSQPRSCFVE